MKSIFLVVAFVVAVLVAGYLFWLVTKRPAEVPAAKESAPVEVPQHQAISGVTLNRAFPSVSDAGLKLAYTKEKDGFSQADLSQDGKKIAMLTVSDTDTDPSARNKFKTAKRIAGFPAASIGGQATAVLVGGRYQVQVQSVAPSFTAADREAWLAKFKLAELAAVAGN